MEPCVLVASCCKELIPTDKIIKQILETEDLPEPLSLVDGIRSFPWNIKTKYYEADIHICSMDEKTIGNQAFAESVNAAILCFDSSSNTGLAEVEQWLTFVREFEPDVNILICESCVDLPTFQQKGSQETANLGVQKTDAQKWCIEHNFELVELNPIESDTESEVEDDDFPESLGIKRVIQALHAHIWPNLKLKEISGRSQTSTEFQSALSGISGLISTPGAESLINGGSLLGSSTSSASGGSQSNDTDPKLKVAKVKPIVRRSIGEIDGIISEDSMSDSLGSGDAAVHTENQAEVENLPSTTSNQERNRRSEKIDAMLEAMDALPEENFEQLFQNLSEMKAKAQNLSPTQRRAYAEKMTMAFWRSIGGNESEIEGLSSDEEVDGEV